MKPIARDVNRFILTKYGIRPNKGGTEIPNVGRKDLAKLFAELGFLKGVEIGVEQGAYSEVLVEANPEATIYGVDPWLAYPGYREHVTQSKLEGFYQATLARMQPYPLWRAIRKFSTEAAMDFRDEELDWVYIDGNHTLPFVINDIIEWSKKVKVGGIVSGHDYRTSVRIKSMMHVPYAVKCYTEAYRIPLWYLFGRKDKRPGEVRDDNRSWMWVKPR